MSKRTEGWRDPFLRGIEVIHGNGRRERLSLQRKRLQALGRDVEAAGPDYSDWILDSLFGSVGPKKERAVALQIEHGNGRFVLRRDLKTNAAEITERDGRQRPITDQEIMDGLGCDRRTFERALVIRGREVAGIGPGRDALGQALRETFGLDVEEPTSVKGPSEDEKRALKKRIPQIEETLRELENDDQKIPSQVIDPPELGDLLEAMDEAREIDRRLVKKRLDLGTMIEELDGERGRAAAHSGHLRELAATAAPLDEAESALEGMRKVGEDQRLVALGLTALIVGLVASTGLALAGHFALDDPSMARTGASSIVGVLALGVAGWMARTYFLYRTSLRARRLRSRRDALREKARRIISRLGGPADLDRLDGASLHRVIEHVSSRTTASDLKVLLAPFREGVGERQWLENLARGLERDVAGVARGAEDGPGLPIVRATSAAITLAQSWGRALENNRKILELHFEERLDRRVEKELLEQALEAAKKRLAQVDSAATPAAGPDRTDAFRRRLESAFSPILTEILGPNAPGNFDGNLVPCRGEEPDAATNALVVTAARLLFRTGKMAAVRSFGLWIVDPGLAMDADREGRLLSWIARENRLGRVHLTASRPELFESMTRRGGDLWSVLVSESRSAMEPVSGESKNVELNSANELRGELVR